MKKRLMSLLLSAAMVMSMIVVPSSAAETPIELSVDIAQETVAPGETFDVKISISDTDSEREYSGIKFKLLFDPDVLTPLDVMGGKKPVYAKIGSTWEGTFTPNYPKKEIDGKRYISVNLVNPMGMYGTGDIATMKFQVVSDTLAPEAALTLDVEKALYVQYNDDETTTDIDFSTNGELTITDNSVVIKHPLSVSTGNYNQQSASSVALNGSYTNDGTVDSSKITAGIKWGYSADAMDNDCDFGATINNITEGATVHYQAYAAIDGGATYTGSTKEFTMAPAAPAHIDSITGSGTETNPYKANVLDQFNQPIDTDVTLTIDNAPDGVTISDGVVSVDFTKVLDSTSVNVVASVEGLEPCVISHAIERDNSIDRIEIDEIEEINVPTYADVQENGAKVVNLSATAYDKYGVATPIDADFTVDAAEGIDFDASTDTVSISNTASAGSVKVTAIYGDKSDETELKTQRAPSIPTYIVMPETGSITIPTGDIPATDSFPAVVYDQYYTVLTENVDVVYTFEGADGLTFDNATVSVDKTAQNGATGILTATVNGTNISAQTTITAVSVMIEGITTKPATYGMTWAQIVDISNAKATLDGADITHTGEFIITDANNIPNAGDNVTYEVRFVSGQYDVATTGSAAIAQKNISATWANYTDLVYTGKPMNVTASVGVEGVNVTVTGGDAVNAGENYSATATLDNDNYTLTNPECAYSIAKADIPSFDDAGPQQISFRKIGDINNVIKLVADEVEAYGFGGETDKLDGTITIDRDLSEFGAGSVLTVEAIFTPDNDNYNAWTFSFQLEITEGEPQTVEITDDFYEAVFTYGDEPFDLKQYISVKRGEEVVNAPAFTFSIDPYWAEDPSVSVDESGKVSIIAAGMTTINFTVEGNDDYADYPDSVTLNIEQKELTFDTSNIAAIEIPYNGGNYIDVAGTTLLEGIKLDGIVGNDDVKLDMTNAYMSFEDSYNANASHSVVFDNFLLTGEDADNYVINALEDMTVSVTKADPVITFYEPSLNQTVSNVTAVIAHMDPSSDAAEVIIDYQLPAVESVPCGHEPTEEEPECNHEDCGYVKGKDAEWVTEVPTAKGEYPVRAYTKGDSNLNAISVENAAIATLKITEPYSGGGGSITPTYTASVQKSENGSVSLSPKNAAKGKVVTINVKPNEGYELKTLTVTDAKGNDIAVTYKDGKPTFVMPASKVTVAAEFAKIPEVCLSDNYSDLDSTAWYHEAVDYVLENGIMTGISADKFAPAMNLTRGMVVQMLWAMEGKPVVNYAMSFKDVAADAWYAEAVRWAAAQGIVTGYSADKFGANDAVTREQMAVMLYGYARYKGADLSVGENTNILSYTDAFSISNWAFSGLQWACGEGILSGKTGGYLDPTGTATRMEAAQMLMKLSAALAD